MNFRTLLKRLTLMNQMAEGGDLGGGGASEPSAALVAPDAGSAPVTEPSAPASVAAPTDPAKPTSMLDAISKALAQNEPKAPDGQTGQPRGPDGKFLPKTGEQVQQPGQAPAQAKKEGDPQQPAKPEDELLQMPEGLQPKAQERFQRLANVNREMAAELEQLRPMRESVEYVQQHFHQNQVKPEQFEQAVAVIGALNRGDFQTAVRFMQEQMRLISLQTGQPLPGVDPLEGFPDLRQAVDTLQINEQAAIELAARRTREAQALQMQQSQHQQQAQEQQAAQAHQAGVKAVDKLCRDLAQTDLDYAAIEERLLPHLGALLQGVPPHMYAQKVKQQYDLIKSTITAVRPAPPAAGGAMLRPTGSAGAATRPKSPFEAMWGKPQPIA